MQIPPCAVGHGQLAALEAGYVGRAVGIAQHEFGHSFTGLADEYTTPYPGYPACSDGGGTVVSVTVPDEVPGTVPDTEAQPEIPARR